MKIWIVGALGLVGSALREAAPSALATSRLDADIADIGSLSSFVEKHPGITHIVNCAAFSLVDASESRRSEAMQGNAEGPENLGIIAKGIGARLVHISTDYVFPGDLRRPLKETDPTAPPNFYGETKLEGERRLSAILPQACIIRTSSVFGKGGKNFLSKLLQIFQEKEEIFLNDDQWGRPTYAPDLAQGILRMLDVSGLYHFANAGAATKYTFGCAMKSLDEEAGIQVRTKKLAGTPGFAFPSLCKRPLYSVFDTSKIEQVLKTPIRPWQEALKEFLCASGSS